jgi:DNA-binding NtrC family response regulator
MTVPVVLVADDDAPVRNALSRLLQEQACEVIAVKDGTEALAAIQPGLDLIITDLLMPGATGMAVLKTARQRAPQTPVILLTAHGSIADCVSALQAGAYNFLCKPFHEHELASLVEQALGERRSAVPSGTPGKGRPARPQAMLLGDSPRLADVLAAIQAVAPTDATVLLAGETGTGKEVVARLLHALSGRSAGPFVPVNSGAIPDGLVESELFGHARGAFTGASEKRIGRFVQADGGTLFLDEIAELPHPLQVKLLRALQEREITPVGDSRSIPVDVRIIAATHRNLEAMVEEGKFRQDLFYRLSVVPIEIPSLRERACDVPILTRHFLDAMSRRHGKSVSMSAEALEIMSAYSWPGNVRELENLVEQCVIMASGPEVAAASLPRKLREGAGKSAPTVATPAGAPAEHPLVPTLGETGLDLPALLTRVEHHYLDAAMVLAGGNKNKAAHLLGLNRTTLVEKLKRK